jgi:hypothetical protein
VWPLLLACAPPPAAPSPAIVTAPAPARPIFQLSGRASSAGLDTPTLAGGAALLGTGCVTANRTLDGDGPPCFAEVWQAADRSVAVLRAGHRLRFDGQRGRTSWSQVDGPLAWCLGDPLAIPPAGDPGGLRTLDVDTWVVHVSGDNRCALTGDLRLAATVDHAAWDDIRAAGHPWDAGGRDAARTTMFAAVRDAVAHHWRTLDAAARADALGMLAEDPHPDAKRLLARHRPRR